MPPPPTSVPSPSPFISAAPTPRAPTSRPTDICHTSRDTTRECLLSPSMLLFWFLIVLPVALALFVLTLRKIQELARRLLCDRRAALERTGGAQHTEMTRTQQQRHTAEDAPIAAQKDVETL